MSLAIVNINDAGIQLTVEGDLVRTSPGYAVMNGDTLLTGEAASEKAKLLPRWTNTRFWSQLDTNPLPNGTARVRHHADIAFAHLEDLWKTIGNKASEAIFIVPGYYRTEHLGLLLGMARECGVPVSGIVDHSIVAASNLPLRQTVLHLDIHLHAVTLTRVQNNGALTRKQVSVPVEAGLFTLWDRWANIIADQFIQTTRFDPMHTAETEQALFNKLPGWIAALGDTQTHNFSLEVNGTSHSVSVSKDALMQACTTIYPPIIQAIRSELSSGESASLLLSHRLSGFPGLHDSLALVNGIEPLTLGELKAVSSARVNAVEIIGEPGSVSHVVQLQSGELSAEADTQVRPNGATHLLWNNEAFPIGKGIRIDRDLSNGPVSSDDPACTITVRNQQTTLEANKPESITVNGESVTSARTLQPGDRLEIDGNAVMVISVLGHG